MGNTVLGHRPIFPLGGRGLPFECKFSSLYLVKEFRRFLGENEPKIGKNWPNISQKSGKQLAKNWQKKGGSRFTVKALRICT